MAPSAVIFARASGLDCRECRSRNWQGSAGLCHGPSGRAVREVSMAEPEDEVVGVYELLDAIEAVIQAAAPAKREILAKSIDTYPESSPMIFYWKSGSQAPGLLNSLLQ